MRLNKINILTALLLVAAVLPFGKTNAQQEEVFKWMSVGSLHNWYSSMGCERETAYENQQQSGMQWPAEFINQDMQAAKGLWIGTKNYTDDDGTLYAYKVVHCGPRTVAANKNEFFPIKFETWARYTPTKAVVDGAETYMDELEIDKVDPTLPCDVMLYNEVNTQIGITEKRKIFQFGQQYHNNYIVTEYTFVNTGNTDSDPAIERPNQTLSDVYFYFQYRLAPCRETRNMIGNSSGWGVNTMIDFRGDGRKVDADNPLGLRFTYAYHGKYSAGTFSKGYDNLGAPMWSYASPMAKSDTVGRLGAVQFPGILTLHADKSASDKSDDPSQPVTTAYESSDGDLNSNNDAYNSSKMNNEYAAMKRGNEQTRHVDFIEPGGKFDEPTNDPSKGSQNGAGYSNALGYGPYTLAPGDSITLVLVEGVDGLSRDKAIEYGQQFKKGQISAKQKNTYFLTGKDSLIKTFTRAKAAFDAGWNIPQPPQAPVDFTVTSAGGRIELSWGVSKDDPLKNKISGFEIYRSISMTEPGYASGRWDTKYEKIATVGSDVRAYTDTTCILNFAYFYYMVALGDPADNNNSAINPTGALRSNRFFAQSYEPAYKKKPGKADLSGVRVVPNPFIIGGKEGYSTYPSEPNKITFSNLTKVCTIKIYSELGELIQTLEHNNGSSEEYWYSTTSSNQFIVSGIYIAVITDDTGAQKIAKFVVIR